MAQADLDKETLDKRIADLGFAPAMHNHELSSEKQAAVMKWKGAEHPPQFMKGIFSAFQASGGKVQGLRNFVLLSGKAYNLDCQSLKNLAARAVNLAVCSFVLSLRFFQRHAYVLSKKPCIGRR